MRRFLAALFVSLFFLFTPFVTHAADFKTDYQVQYILSQDKSNLKTHVVFVIAITNLKSDAYVKNFSISFPHDFFITNLKASDDKGPSTARVEQTPDATKIDLSFQDPQIGRDTTNTFYLEFDQDKLFQVNGAVWEVILPTIDDVGKSTYRVIVNLPTNSDKKISIAKPKPDHISGKQIVWDNPTARTIYAVFGDTQYYNLALTYHIKNSQLTPIYTDVAFPPDTFYQKIYVDSIRPAPISVSQDSDGNFLGRYLVLPNETKSIIFNGFAQISTKPRDEIRTPIGEEFNLQKPYLLTQTKYWTINNLAPIANLKDAKSIYDYVTSSLIYNYNKLANKNTRLGASQVMSTPDQAVCVEFSDLFVATAREKGIYSREIEGYGYANDTQLRPISAFSDVLHSWPEYFDTDRGIWVQVDPTWQNTSGIDYFSSLDLNHIAFVIHGKRPDYPLPAGMYKLENSKDITIQPASFIPKEKIDIALDSFKFPSTLHNTFSYHSDLVIVNKSNVYAWDIPIEVKTTNFNSSVTKTKLISLAPGEKRTLPVDFSTNAGNTSTKGMVQININNKQVASKEVEIRPLYYSVSVKIAIGLFAFCVLALVLILRFRHPKRHK